MLTVLDRRGYWTVEGNTGEVGYWKRVGNRYYIYLLILKEEEKQRDRKRERERVREG